MFEPTRLSGEYLIDAYSQTVPIHPRSVRSVTVTEQMQQPGTHRRRPTPRRQRR
jgi:hypothetical protein